MRRRPAPERTAEGERAEQPVDSRARFTGRGWAFLGAGAVWTAAVVAGFFLRRPAESDTDGPVLAH